MRFRGERFGEEVREVVIATTPLHLKVTLVYTIADPMIPHVGRFCPFCFDGISCHAYRTLIVAEN